MKLVCRIKDGGLNWVTTHGERVNKSIPAAIHSSQQAAVIVGRPNGHIIGKGNDAVPGIAVDEVARGAVWILRHDRKIVILELYPDGAEVLRAERLGHSPILAERMVGALPSRAV